MARRGRSAAHGGGHDGTGSMRWLLTYADLITLLMVFFVVLYSMARVDAEKYAEVAGALRRSFGGNSRGTMMLPLPGGASGGAPAPVLAAAPGAAADLPDWMAVTGVTPSPDTWADSGLAEVGGLVAPPRTPEPARLPEPAPFEGVAEAPPPPAPVAEQAPAPVTPAPSEPPEPPRALRLANATPRTAEPAPPAPRPATVASGTSEAFLARAAAAIKQLPGPPGGVTVQLGQQGLVLEILANLLFDQGQSVLRAEAASLLAPVAGALRDLPYNIMVHGTGEDGPGAAGNWQLAAQRSVSVIDFFIDRGQVPADRLLAVGYGGRTGGGRVTVVVVRPAV